MIYYSKSKLILGDALAKMNKLPSSSIDMILCDLPYGTTKNKWDTVIPLDKLWKQFKRIRKENAAIVLTAQTPFDKILGMSNFKMLKYEWIWVKNVSTGFLNAKKAPLKKHENVLVFYDNLPIYNPQKTFGHPNKKTTHRIGSLNYGQHKISSYESTERYPVSVLNIPHENRLTYIHPTQKPVGLFSYLIQTYTNAGDTVMDCCSGSGTTAIACIDTNRNFICIEKTKNYFYKSKDRIEKHYLKELL